MLISIQLRKRHAARHGKRNHQFELVAKYFRNAAVFGAVKERVTQKSIRDRYMRLAEAYRNKERNRRGMYGIDGEKVTECDTLLADITEAEDDHKQSKNDEKDMKSSQENHFLDTGDSMRAAAVQPVRRSTKTKKAVDANKELESDPDEGLVGVDNTDSPGIQTLRIHTSSGISDTICLDETQLVTNADSRQEESL